MKTLVARIVDPTHLELTEPIDGAPGQVVHVAISEGDESGADEAWAEAARSQFLQAYSAEDAVYDQL